MAGYKIKAVCQNCGGDGLIHDQNSPEGFPSEIPCADCNGTGEIESNLKLDDLWDKILDIKEKCDEIMDKLNE